MNTRSPRGFTLVEMLVSMGAGMIVLVLAVTSLRSTGDGYTRSTSSMSAEREARAVLTIAAEDLSKAVRGREMVFGGGGEGWKKDELGFLCLQPEDAQSSSQWVGDLCAVVYYLDELEIGRDSVRCLMRGFRNSEETFDALRSDGVAGLYEPKSVDEPVAFGVLAFEVEPLVRAGAGAWVEWTRADDAEWQGPDAVRMRLVVARRELMGKLRKEGDWDSSPLLGDPEMADRSPDLEVYEVVNLFSHAN
ncbi:MAG: PilW family protein [Haloferula sp.]